MEKINSDTLHRYRFAFGMTVSVTVFQIVVLFFANSLTLVGDMVHMFSDALVYGGIVFVASGKFAGDELDKANEWMLFFGYGSLFFGAGYVFKEAIDRIVHPVSYPPVIVMMIAGVSIIGNLLAHRKLAGIHHDHQGVQQKNFTAHLLSDIAASTIVFLSAAGVYFFALPAIDAYFSLALVGYMIYLAIHLKKEGGHEHHEHDENDHHRH